MKGEEFTHMWVVELIMEILSFCDDIRFANRYGWSGFLWGLAASVSAAVTYLFFYFDLVILGVVGVIGTIACLVIGIRQIGQDIRKKHEEEAHFREKHGERNG